MPVANTGLASGGQTFEGESSCGLSPPERKTDKSLTENLIEPPFIDITEH